jgi:hypothetical protein
MTGRANPDYNELKLEFGLYVQIFEDNTPSNTTTSRNTGAIALNPTGNAQGDYFFMSLVTGKRLSRHQWTKIPMTNAVTSAVEAMAEKEGQPLIKVGVPLFEWRPNSSVEDFLEEDVESADEYENFAEDIFDPTEPDNDVVEEPNSYDDIETPTTTMLPSQMSMQLMIPLFLSLFSMVLGLVDMIPTPTKVPRHTTIPETKIPATILQTRPLSPTQTKIRVPIGTTSGATEADPTATDLITKWMIP